MKVKFCGITHSKDAQEAFDLGADFVGLVLTQGEAKSISDDQALALIQKFETKTSSFVGIFSEPNLNIVAKRAQKLRLEWVQIIAPENIKDLFPLKNFNKFLVLPVESNGCYKPRNYSCEKDSFWIYDHKNFGEGNSFDWDSFEKKEEGPFFVAGGLNDKNVEKAINKLCPDGVDVSTGICCENKVDKDLKKMRQFLEVAKGIKR